MKNEMKNFAPMVVFAYNRPDHLQKTLDALRKNVGVAESELHIFCDGPKENATPETRARIERVREIARASQFAKSTTVHVQEKNRGLANSVINGVASVLACHERAIVVEDDLETSPGFLRFMNLALDFYENYPNVFSIGGHSYGRRALKIPADYPHDVFVSPRGCSWGYATWRDRWERVNWQDATAWEECLASAAQSAAFDRGGADLTKMLRQHIEGKIDSWFIRFLFAHYKHRAVSILPCDTLVRNTGCDGSGVHCDATTAREEVGEWVSLENPRFVSELFEDEKIIAALRGVVRPRKRTFKERYGKKWRRLMRVFTRRRGGAECP